MLKLPVIRVLDLHKNVYKRAKTKVTSLRHQPVYTAYYALSPGKLEHVIDPFLLMYLISYNINNADMKQINFLSWIRKKVI